MDYEQWTPLGRGDPLKNDPTYDYVPPVLDRVHYWIDPASRKPDASLPGETHKTEILVLGVSSKKPSTSTSVIADSRRDTYDPFLKFVEGPKFGMQNNYQRMSRPHYSMSPSYYGSHVYSNKNKQTEYLSNKNEQRVPYTMLMPPPVPDKDPLQSEMMTYKQAFNSLTTTEYPNLRTTVKPSTNAALTSGTSSFTIQQSNLLFHSSTLGSQDEFRDKGQFGALGAPSSQVTWRTPLASPPESTKSILKNQKPQSSESYMEIQQTFLPHNSSNTKPNSVTSVLKEESHSIMHKGHVTDDDLDIQNTYVNIGKPEAQMHSPTDMEISSVSVEPPHIPLRQTPVLMRPSTSPNMMHLSTDLTQMNYKNPTSMMTKLQITPMTLQTLQTIQTMKAPPISQPPPMSFTKRPTSSLLGLLQKESTLSTTKLSLTSSAEVMSKPKPTITGMFTTPTPTITTTVTSLTTDPLFKHYKQPTEPLKGPMYLIIQGHSKVKTYGPGKQIHGIAVQESNEIPSEEKDEYTVKHLHGYNKKDGNEGRPRQGRSSKLQTLFHVVQTGLGAIDFSETAANRRKDDDVQEAQLVVRYDVSAQTDTTSERYYKGIVESGDMARNIKDD